ncbi:30S ribosomal protein S6e [Candidatus Pacearchaeota archaeon]|nr:30S ribosomal protein S6e [Candidatus Pacearchaeota archaeon]
MAFKFNISEKGKTFKLETDSEFFLGKKIGDVFNGKELNSELKNFELKITGTSDKSGFPGKEGEQGPQLRGILLSKGKFLRKVPHKGFRRKKSVRGNEVSSSTVQINCSVVKGDKPLDSILKNEVKSE